MSSGRGFYWSRHVWLSHGGFKICQCLSNTSTISWKTSDPLIAIVELKYSVTQFAWLAKDQGSISRNLVEADRTSRGPNFLFWTPQTPGQMWHADTHTDKTAMHIKYELFLIYFVMVIISSLLKSKITFSFFFVIFFVYILHLIFTYYFCMENIHDLSEYMFMYSCKKYTQQYAQNIYIHIYLT